MFPPSFVEKPSRDKGIILPQRQQPPKCKVVIWQFPYIVRNMTLPKFGFVAPQRAERFFGIVGKVNMSSLSM